MFRPKSHPAPLAPSAPPPPAAPRTTSPSPNARALSDQRSYGVLSALVVPLPDWISAELIVGIVVTGVVAFAVAGFLGFPYSPGGLSAFPFNKPAALFLYGCMLALLLLVFVLRHPSPRQEMAGDPNRVIARPGQVVWAVSVALLSMVVVVLIYFHPPFLTTWLDMVAVWLRLHGSGKLLANLVNGWLVGVYALDALGRWTGSIGRLVAGWSKRDLREKRYATTLGMLGNDLVAGSVLVGLLALGFRADLLRRVAQALQLGIRAGGGPAISDCTVSLYLDPCQGVHLNPNVLPTITYVDTILALSLLGGGLAFLALYLLVRALQAKRPLGEVLQDALGQLRHINRVLALGIEALVAPSRRVAWPALIFGGIGAIAVAAGATNRYLHLLSCEHQWVVYGKALEKVSGCVATSMPFDTNPLGYAELGRALVFAALAAVLLVMAAVVQLYDRKNPDRSERQVAGYWLPALARVGATVLIPFGVLSLAMSVFNFVLIQTHANGQAAGAIPMSYYPPGVITYVAFVGLLAILGWRLVRGKHSQATFSGTQDEGEDEGRVG